MRNTTTVANIATAVAGGTTSTTLLAANPYRGGATIYNESSAALLVHLSATASSTLFTTRIAGSAYYELPEGYTGVVSGVWASAAGSAMVIERV